MAEYIEREARYIDINKLIIPKGFLNQDLNVPKLLDWLKSQHTADVVEVVRCKDCKRYNKPRLKYCSLTLCYMQSDDFCSYGKNKEGAEE